MKILICPDSFKGSIDSLGAAKVINESIGKLLPDSERRILPLADGGEGSSTVIGEALGARTVSLSVCGPYFERVNAKYAILGERAYIEMAEASGICLTDRREPAFATTYGTGELILDAVKRGARELTVFIGGSATCDGGIGMAAALGYGFYDAQGERITPVGEGMARVARIERPSTNALDGVRIFCACDVTNKTYGENGAAYVFGPQKGADEKTVHELDLGLRNLANKIEEDLGVDVHTLSGGGAAGGLGAGLYAFCSAQICGGFELIGRAVGLEQSVEWADVVITGEGCTDAQSVMGKVVGKINDLCLRYGKKCVLVSGMIKDEQALAEAGIGDAYSCTEIAGSAAESMKNTEKYIALAAQRAAKTF